MVLLITYISGCIAGEYEKSENNPRLLFCHCEESVCHLPYGTKFNPFYLREMRRDGISKQIIQAKNADLIDTPGSATCSTCTLDSNGKLYCCDGAQIGKIY